MIVLAIDPSGSFEEGKGTTGWALFESTNRTPVLLAYGHIPALKYKTISEYWGAVKSLIKPTYIVVIEDYILYANKAMQQINSKMETSKLIGILQQYCAENDIKFFMQLAVQVKSRWSDRIMEYKKIIEPKGRTYFALGRITNNHERDAMRHALHFIYFTAKKKGIIE